MTIKALYPTVRPTLNLDFAKAKALDSRVTYTRASTGTYVGADGLIKTAASGAARFDHDPVTGESLGFLVESAATNLRTLSTDFSSGWGFNANVTVASGQTSPTGDSTASLVTINAGTFVARIGEKFAFSSTIVYTRSLFVKKTNQRYIWCGDQNTGGFSPNYRFDLDLGTGTVVSGGGFNSGFSITPFSNGYFRISVSCTSADIFTWTANNNASFNPLISASGSAVHDGTESFIVWGYQIEQAFFSTSYIPTSGSTVTRAADVATLSNANSSVFPTSAFTTINTPFGTAGGGSTVKLVGPTIKRTAIYASDLPQAQINTLTNTGDFWRWRVLGSSFALPGFTTNGSVTVDWGDGAVETLTTAVHTFTNGGGYHDIGFRLNSGTFFKPNINNNATYKDRVIAVGPAPASMKLDALGAFYIGAALKAFDATVDTTGGTNFQDAWRSCSSLTSFPLINTAAVTNFTNTWNGCSGFTSFPLINTAAVTNFLNAWQSCSSLTSFPLINTAAATSLRGAWSTCTGLTSFPLINSAACTNFLQTWNGCSGLTSFPLISTGAGTDFQSAWTGCSSLTSFPLIDTGAGTNFSSAWQSCSGLTSFPLINTGAGTNFASAFSFNPGLTSFPLINTAAGTNFNEAWRACNNLASFPLINTAAGTSFVNTWEGCNKIASFPLINTAAGTNFTATWTSCSTLTSFPLINTAAGTNFTETWRNCSGLTSFPALSFVSATTMRIAWQNCTSLSSFPANRFDSTGTLASNAFLNAFNNCALTATSIENILTSLATNGQSNITLDLNGGTNAGASTWTTAANAAYATLISRGWTITRNA